MIRVVNKEEKTLENVLATLSMPSTSNVPIWVYVIFRKNISSGHNKVTVNISTDGPVFWNRYVIYVFCCSCHFDRHEVYFYQIKIEKLFKNRLLDYFAFYLKLNVDKKALVDLQRCSFSIILAI